MPTSILNNNSSIDANNCGIITEIAKDIAYLIVRKRYWSALALCLIMPDICSEALYPKLKRSIVRGKGSAGAAYKKIWTEFISPKLCELDLDAQKGWDLRCSILHNANSSFKDKTGHWDYKIHSAGESGYKKLPGGQFSLINLPPMGVTIVSEEFSVDENGNQTSICKQIHKQATIHLETICNNIVAGCANCYKAHSEKFNNIKYDIF